MQQLSIVLAFIFGVIFTAALLALAVLIPDPTPRQFEIFRIVIAVSVAGIAAMVPGLLNLRFKQGAMLSIQAGGALAVFIVVYFYSPARWVNTSPNIHQSTSGPGSPAISNIKGNVTTVNGNNNP